MKTQHLALSLVLLLGCPPSEKDPAVPPPNPPVDTDWCDDMCNHLNALGCEEGEPIYNNDLPGPMDTPNQECSDWCVEMQNRGVFLNPRCVSTVPTCDDIEDWRQKDPKTCAQDKR